MPAGLGVVARDKVALDPGRAHLKRLLDLRTDPSADARSEISDEARVGQMEIASTFPAVVEILDRPPAYILHEAAVLAAALFEASDEMGAECRLENMRQGEDRRRLGRLHSAAAIRLSEPASDRPHPEGRRRRRAASGRGSPRIARRRRRAPSRRRPIGTRSRESEPRARSLALSRIRRPRRRRRPHHRRPGAGWPRARQARPPPPGAAADPRNASAMARPGKGSKANRWRPELSRKALSPGWAGDFSAKSTCSDIDFPSIAPRLATSRRTREARGQNLILVDNRVPRRPDFRSPIR